MRRDLSRRLLLVDFSEGLATVAECKLKGDSFDLNQIDVTVLPEDATDKGCPSDPAAMAELLKSVIAERNVVAKRCAVVMPAIAFTAVPLCIDAEISIDQALTELENPDPSCSFPSPENRPTLT